jgi:sugar phosphate isomerase/epimerase
MEPFISTSCIKGKGSRFEKDVFKVLEVFKRLNIQNIELGSAHSFAVDLSPIISMKKDHLFIVHNVFPPTRKPFMMNPASGSRIRSLTVKTAKASIDFCRRIDARLYSLHTGYLSEIDDRGMPATSIVLARENAIANIISSIRRICDHAKSYGISIALENSGVQGPQQISFASSQYRELLDDIGTKNLGLLIDLAHLQISNSHHKFDMAGYIDDIKDRILEFHVAVGTRKGDNLPLRDEFILRDFGLAKSTLGRACLTLEANLLTGNSLPQQVSLLRKAIALV